jgi:branched-chain amino acid transport system ATP-binding protein
VSPPLLETKRLSKNFGVLRAVDDVSITIPEGARYALIGPNGAGKTTLVSMLSGALSSTSGDITFAGVDLTHVPMHIRVRHGLARTYQITSLFPRLTARAQVALAIFERDGMGWKWLTPRNRMTAQYEEASSLLELVKLGADADVPVGGLPYGKQRLLEIALGLAARPRLLLLDEPAAGIPSTQSAELFEVIDALPASTAILFIEHDMDLVFRFAQKIIVLMNGQVFMEGTPSEIASNTSVRQIYLGEGDHD